MATYLYNLLLNNYPYLFKCGLMLQLEFKQNKDLIQN